ncbi:hypothetical protein [Bradyrhizobium iriomotense]|uniref:Uncharacterized protein n=1 Tax=Bradyrhizobium iriomotense TaxID=441950 RepID=A0ABQ6BAC8_9BRAD|nr:hypothetical protein [Bradyrhizobium iriomotense]GLR91364.1 hypothetical protein GCM10007857_80810 [Bradyrhizobium iriomotense]
MNKPVIPRQLEMTCGLPLVESPTLKADLAKLDQMTIAEVTPVGEAEDDFDWNDDDSIILKEQRATAAYRNKAGELIIRQRASWDEERDTFVFISRENEVTFLEGLAKRAKES